MLLKKMVNKLTESIIIKNWTTKNSTRRSRNAYLSGWEKKETNGSYRKVDINLQLRWEPEMESYNRGTSSDTGSLNDFTLAPVPAILMT